MISFFKGILNFLRGIVNYIIRGALLMVASYSFRFVTGWATGPLVQMGLQVGVMAVSLYIIEKVLYGIFPFLEGMTSGSLENMPY